MFWNGISRGLTDKCFSAEELLGIFSDQDNVADSPDLGPPPVAHFEEGDPVKFEPARGSAPTTDAEDGSAQNRLFANLETRRKRRESHVAQTKIHGTADPQPLHPDPSSPADSSTPLVSQSLRSSAKRKLNATEEENKTSGEVREKSSQDENGFMPNRIRQVMADSNTNVPVKSTVLKRGDILLLNHAASRESTTEEVTRDKKVREVDVAGVMNNRKALGPSKSGFCT